LVSSDENAMDHGPWMDENEMNGSPSGLIIYTCIDGTVHNAPCIGINSRRSCT
jgi:hypothetical protein